MDNSEYAARALSLLELGRAEEALRLVAPFVATSGDPAAHAVAVVALLALNRPADAAWAAQAALEACGPVPELARVASYAFRDVGAPVKAVAAARAGVQMAPEWVPGLLALTQAELAMGHKAQAKQALDVALRVAPDDPDDPDVRLVAADLALAWGDRKLAREHCREALRLDPLSAAAMRGMGLLDEQRNRIGRAARWYAQALRLTPGDEELVRPVRSLFGRLLVAVTIAFVVASFVVFIAFMDRADPAPNRQNPGGVSDAVFWVVWIIGFGGVFTALLWSSIRGVPRAVLAALRSETRIYHRVRRCARMTLVYATTVLLTILAALAPIGSARDRMPVVFLLWLTSMTLMVVAVIMLRITFGYGQTRAAKAHPRDNAFAR